MTRARTILAILILTTLAAAQSKEQTSAKDVKLPSEDTVNSFLHQMFGYDPSVSYKVAEIKPAEVEGLAEVVVLLNTTQGQQVNKLYVGSDGTHALIGDVIPFGSRPFEADRQKLQKANGPSKGPANAPVTIVEFSDLQCPHCKEAQPKIDKMLADEPNVRFIYQSLPLPMHDWAAKAAAYADCVGRASNPAFWKFVQGTYDAQSDITASNADEKLTGIATTSGVNGKDIAVCAAKPDTQTRVEASADLAKSLELNSTPTLFINGRKVASLGQLPDPILKALVDFAANDTGSPKQQAAGK